MNTKKYDDGLSDTQAQFALHNELERRGKLGEGINGKAAKLALNTGTLISNILGSKGLHLVDFGIKRGKQRSLFNAAGHAKSQFSLIGVNDAAVVEGDQVQGIGMQVSKKVKGSQRQGFGWQSGGEIGKNQTQVIGFQGAKKVEEQKQGLGLQGNGESKRQEQIYGIQYTKEGGTQKQESGIQSAQHIGNEQIQESGKTYIGTKGENKEDAFKEV